MGGRGGSTRPYFYGKRSAIVSEVNTHFTIPFHHTRVASSFTYMPFQTVVQSVVHRPQRARSKRRGCHA